MNRPRDPFPECATYDIDIARISLEDLREMFNGRSRSALHRDCRELEVACTHGVDRDGAWTLYVYMAWYQFMRNKKVARVRRQRYWDMCTPDHLKRPGVKCSADTADETIRESFLTQIGKTYADFEQAWKKLVDTKKETYAKVTVDV
ncbi:hypothetical protein Lepto7375DRAFT_7396 [Leptolyngbya sp. PCC 7375]|nr:hypothetical protein Lepto7375DRAFT_7396 [Leptolyngbya sp. PCC 7375]